MEYRNPASCSWEEEGDSMENEERAEQARERRFGAEKSEGWPQRGRPEKRDPWRESVGGGENAEKSDGWPTEKGFGGSSFGWTAPKRERTVKRDSWGESIDREENAEKSDDWSQRERRSENREPWRDSVGGAENAKKSDGWPTGGGFGASGWTAPRRERAEKSDPWRESMDGGENADRQTNTTRDSWNDYAAESTSTKQKARLGGFGAASYSARVLGDVVLSDCRALVVVPGGAEWVIRELFETHPEYCWKYAGTGAIAQYHFELATQQIVTRVIDTAPSGQGTSSLPIFYASVPFFYSPTEFSVQPKYLDKFREKMTAEMNSVYNAGGNSVFEREQLVPGVACAIITTGNWVRGRMRKLAGQEMALVEFVDYGTTMIVNIDTLFWLRRRFGKVPPMALPCKMKDVYINDLDTAKVEQFQQIIESCKYTVRVELTNAVEPYVVNLYHPTVEGDNIGRVFYRREDDAKREWTKQHNWEGHVRRMNNDNDSDFEQEDEEYSDDEFEPDAPSAFFVRTMDRCAKANRASHQLLHLGHAENIRFLAVHDDWQMDTRASVEERLSEQFATLPPLPSHWVTVNTACCVRRADGTVARATIESVDEKRIELVLSDYGSWLEIDRCRVEEMLRPLPSEFDMAPLCYLVSLSDSYNHMPHAGEADVLMEVIREFRKANFVADRKHKRVPLRGVLVSPDRVDIGEEVQRRLSAMRVDVHCRAVSVWQSSSSRLSHLIRSNYKYRLQPANSLMKGNATLTTLFK